jgi:hypothetical protein
MVYEVGLCIVWIFFDMANEIIKMGAFNRFEEFFSIK